MKNLANLSLVLTIASSILVGQPSTPNDPMARFKPFVGQWEVRHTLYRGPGQAPEVFEGTADIYFISDGTVLVVDESTPDKRYRFVGYHAYDQHTGKYLNWTASSKIVLAWGEVFQTRRLDPRTGQIDSLVGKGVWQILSADKNMFTALRVQPDGTEIPFKQEVYTRARR
jgi:hypothetical protein